MTLTAVSTFAGVGGFDIALERAGIEVVATVEIDNKARGVLAAHFENAAHFTDVMEVTGEQLINAGFNPDRGIIVGGFPCQDLSTAGRRAGLDGSRSGLFWQICRLLDETKARYFIIENVPGLLSSNNGRDMGTVVGALVERGYGVAYRVLDAQHFGVPQRRRRVFIVGVLGGDWRAPAQVLDLAEGRTRTTGAGTAQGDESSTGAGRSASSDRSFVTYTKARRAQNVDDFETWVESPVTPTLNIFDNMTETRATELIVTPEGVRRLTPLECERLQGFPDNWTAQRYDFKKRSLVAQADSARIQQMGNAVAVPVVEWIAKRLVATHG
jgi:DNA (cytosine-5)-methyltransferase 1